MKKTLLLIIVLFLLSGTNQAQQKYWIYFKDTDAIKRHDNSVVSSSESGVYVNDLKQLGVEPIVHSKWLNAISALLNDQQLETVENLYFVKEIVSINTHLKVLSTGKSNSRTYTRALRQIEADTLVAMGLNGQGVKIGIIDGGFLDADEKSALKSVIDNNKVVAYKNFIDPHIKSPYEGVARNRDGHGTEVWEIIAGKESRDYYRGLATHANYYLARTDQGDKEYRGEEDYWVAALEWMHEQGVKLVNSSLGYSTGYDNPDENYSRSQVDGQSSAITRAANIAANEKGMILVISAGNDGSSGFRIISIPADAKGILSVGATAFKHWNKAGYSGVGPEHIQEIKPEVVCFSLAGTSFSAPVITGLAACIWQAHPDLTNEEVIDLIKQSSHLSYSPNNYIGYGVPNAPRLIRLLNSEPNDIDYREINSADDVVYLNFPKETNIVMFHKKNNRIVVRQEVIKSRRGHVLVRKEEDVVRTTVATPNKTVEIFWEN